MTAKLDPDFKNLKACCKAMDAIEPRMRRVTLEFLWDKYIVHPTIPNWCPLPDAPKEEK